MWLAVRSEHGQVLSTGFVMGDVQHETLIKASHQAADGYDLNEHSVYSQAETLNP